MSGERFFAREDLCEILGISVDDVKNAWADGKTMAQIIQEKGLNQDDVQKRAQDAHSARMKTQLQALVDKGIITQDQADRRLQFMHAHMGMGYLR